MQASRAIGGLPEVIVGEDQTWLGGPTRPPRKPGARPRYVDYGGLATCPSPVDCDDATLYSFILDADHGRLAALCERVFSAPSGGDLDLRPLGRHVMLTFGNVEQIKPQLEPWCQMGHVSERQVALWVPVVAVRSRQGRPIAMSLGWFVPYMWVDNPISLTGGREIYGYNENWGWVELPMDGERASQQKITDAGVTVKRISGRPLLGEFEFTLHHLDSHPVGRELGVQSQVTRLAFEIEMDFVLDDGQVLWQGTAS